MKLERDKLYLTRNGKKFKIIYTEGIGRYCCLGLSENDVLYWYTDDGKVLIRGSDDLDLVAEYKQPREFWINISSNFGHSGLYTDEETAWKCVSSDTRETIKVREVLE